MATFTVNTAIPSGDAIGTAWMTNFNNGINFMGGAAGTAISKDLFFATQATAQQLSAGTFEAMLWQTEDIDAASGHSTTTNPGRYTSQAVGTATFELSGAIAIAGTSTLAGTQTFEIAWYKNGSAIATDAIALAIYTGGATNGQTLNAPTYQVKLVANDYVQLFVKAPVTCATDVTGQVSVCGVELVARA